MIISWPYEELNLEGYVGGMRSDKILHMGTRGQSCPQPDSPQCGEGLSHTSWVEHYKLPRDKRKISKGGQFYLNKEDLEKLQVHFIQLRTILSESCYLAWMQLSLWVLPGNQWQGIAQIFCSISCPNELSYIKKRLKVKKREKAQQHQVISVTHLSQSSKIWQSGYYIFQNRTNTGI